MNAQSCSRLLSYARQLRSHGLSRQRKKIPNNCGGLRDRCQTWRTEHKLELVPQLQPPARRSPRTSRGIRSATIIRHSLFYWWRVTFSVQATSLWRGKHQFDSLLTQERCVNAFCLFFVYVPLVTSITVNSAAQSVEAYSRPPTC